MFGFPYYEQNPFFDTPRRRGTYPYHTSQEVRQPYGYPAYGQDYEEEDDYMAQRKRQALRQQQLRQQEALRQQELLKQQELLRQQELQRQRELQRQMEAQRRYRAQQQAAMRRHQQSDDEDSEEEDEESEEYEQEVPVLQHRVSPQRSSHHSPNTSPQSSPKHASKQASHLHQQAHPQAPHPHQHPQEAHHQPPHVQPHQQPRKVKIMKKVINLDDAATKIQKVFRGWLIRKLNIVPKLRSIKRVEVDVDSIVQRSAFILELPLDGSATLPEDTQYVGTVPKPFLALELDLTSKLIQLDEISGSYTLVRATRKALVTKVEEILAKVDALKKVYSHTSPVVDVEPAQEVTDPIDVEPTSILASEAIAEPVPLEEDTNIAAEPVPLEEDTSIAAEPVPLEEDTNIAAEPVPLEEDTNIAAEPVPLEEDTNIAAEPVPLEEDTSIAAEPVPLEEDTNIAAEPVPLEEDTNSTPDIPMEDGWVCIDDSSPLVSSADSTLPQPDNILTTTTTQPTLLSTPISIQPVVHQIPTLKHMCYNLCKQLMQKAIAVN